MYRECLEWLYYNNGLSIGHYIDDKLPNENLKLTVTEMHAGNLISIN